MDTRVGRRRALATLGASGLGALLAACGGGGDGDDGAGSTSTTSGTSASGGATTTTATTAGGGVPGAVRSAGELRGLFDDAASCGVTPEGTEGPYYIDVDSIRGDIREDREGSPLRLGIRVLDEACEPIPDAVVEVWHCDAAGAYSGYVAASEAANAGQGDSTDPPVSDDERFLRGGQITDDAGIALITTIYPGWYANRTVHVHAKVHIGNAEVLTAQLYFDDALSDEVLAAGPYTVRTGERVTNATDFLYADGTTLTVHDQDDGHLGLITLTVDRG